MMMNDDDLHLHKAQPVPHFLLLYVQNIDISFFWK